MIDLKDLPAGLTNDSEIAWLCETVSSLPAGAKIVELGSWLGRSAVAMHSALMVSHPNDEEVGILCIDSWSQAYGRKLGIERPREVFLDNTRGCRKLDSLKCDTPYASMMVDSTMKFDMIFIDADHSYEGVTRDLEAWYPRMNDDAVICGHDYRPGNGVHKAVQHFCLTGAKRSIKVITGGTIWVMV